MTRSIQNILEDKFGIDKSEFERISEELSFSNKSLSNYLIDKRLIEEEPFLKGMVM